MSESELETKRKAVIDFATKRHKASAASDKDDALTNILNAVNAATNVEQLNKIENELNRKTENNKYMAFNTKLATLLVEAMQNVVARFSPQKTPEQRTSQPPPKTGGEAVAPPSGGNDDVLTPASQASVARQEGNNEGEKTLDVSSVKQRIDFEGVGAGAGAGAADSSGVEETKTDNNTATMKQVVEGQQDIQATADATQGVQLQHVATQAAQQPGPPMGGAGGAGAPPDVTTPAAALPPGEDEDTDEGDTAEGEFSAGPRQNELPPSETMSLQYRPFDVTFVPANPLEAEPERANLGAGTQADLPIVDMWGFLPSQPSAMDKKPMQLDLVADQQGNMYEESETGGQGADSTFTYLPYAKLSGKMVWIPRHGKAAFKFFTNEDYEDLVSYIVENQGQLTLLYIQQADPGMMVDTIRKTHQQLNVFAELEPMLTSKATKEQIYAEWIELRQFAKAISVYEQNTAGMYQSNATSMSGGIRAAVAAALEKYKIPGYQTPGNKAGKQGPTAKPNAAVEPPPGAASSSLGKRPASQTGLYPVSEFNIQLSNNGPDLKRTKFSFPMI